MLAGWRKSWAIQGAEICCLFLIYRVKIRRRTSKKLDCPGCLNLPSLRLSRVNIRGCPSKKLECPRCRNLLSLRLSRVKIRGCLVEFMYLVFTRMPDCESYRRRLRSLLLYLCYAFRVLINSLVRWFYPVQSETLRFWTKRVLFCSPAQH